PGHSRRAHEHSSRALMSASQATALGPETEVGLLWGRHAGDPIGLDDEALPAPNERAAHVEPRIRLERSMRPDGNTHCLRICDAAGDVEAPQLEGPRRYVLGADHETDQPHAQALTNAGIRGEVPVSLGDPDVEKRRLGR